MKAFAEGAVDGDFLMELRPEDVRDILGVEHPLHVRKIITARDKLTMSAPHGSSAHGLKGVVSSPGLHLRPTVPKEDGDGSIDLKTVFSQVGSPAVTCRLCWSSRTQDTVYVGCSGEEFEAEAFD